MCVNTAAHLSARHRIWSAPPLLHGYPMNKIVIFVLGTAAGTLSSVYIVGLRAKDVVLATGSRVKSLPGLEPDGERIVTSDGHAVLGEIHDRELIPEQLGGDGEATRARVRVGNRDVDGADRGPARRVAGGRFARPEGAASHRLLILQTHRIRGVRRAGVPGAGDRSRSGGGWGAAILVALPSPRP